MPPGLPRRRAGKRRFCRARCKRIYFRPAWPVFIICAIWRIRANVYYYFIQIRAIRRAYSAGHQACVAGSRTRGLIVRAARQAASPQACWPAHAFGPAGRARRRHCRPALLAARPPVTPAGWPGRINCQLRRAGHFIAGWRFRQLARSLMAGQSLGSAPGLGRARCVDNMGCHAGPIRRRLSGSRVYNAYGFAGITFIRHAGRRRIIPGSVIPQQGGSAADRTSQVNNAWAQLRLPACNYGPLPATCSLPLAAWVAIMLIRFSAVCVALPLC